MPENPNGMKKVIHAKSEVEALLKCLSSAIYLLDIARLPPAQFASVFMHFRRAGILNFIFLFSTGLGGELSDTISTKFTMKPKAKSSLTKTAGAEHGKGTLLQSLGRGYCNPSRVPRTDFVEKSAASWISQTRDELWFVQTIELRLRTVIDLRVVETLRLRSVLESPHRTDSQSKILA